MTLLNRLQPGGGLMDHRRVATPRGSIVAGIALAVVWVFSRHLDKRVPPPSPSPPPPPPSPPPTGRAPAGKDTDNNATNTATPEARDGASTPRRARRVPAESLDHKIEASAVPRVMSRDTATPADLRGLVFMTYPQAASTANGDSRVNNSNM